MLETATTQAIRSVLPGVSGGVAGGEAKSASPRNVSYRISGGRPLKGDAHISGSKNAVLPLIAGSLICDGETVIKNVPDLRDVRVLLDILEFLGAEAEFREGTVRIRTHNVQNKPIPAEFVGKLRGSIVLLGPLLARFGMAEMAYPGGCVLGKRPVDAHREAFKQLGANDLSTESVLRFEGKLKSARVILPEFSVTATENTLLATAVIDGETRIEMAATEPHVQEVCKMITVMGAHVDGIGTHTLVVRGKKNLHCASHSVTSDYLEAGALAAAAAVTGGKVRLHGVEFDHLISFLNVLSRMGVIWEYDEVEKILFIDGESSFLSPVKVQTNIFPGFPTDLLPPVGVLMTQARGVSRIFECLFEGRMAYLYELEKMGAHIEVLNSHQALIIGPTRLRGRTVASNDIRAGVAMVVAGLCAEGETTVTDVQYIERGYDKLDWKLRSLGAEIERV